jgi:hypothetical protein
MPRHLKLLQQFLKEKDGILRIYQFLYNNLLSSSYRNRGFNPHAMMVAVGLHRLSVVILCIWRLGQCKPKEGYEVDIYS